ncbi:MAG: LysR family transcriptional regulator [Pantoea sp.]|jgi:DNA-binding transcriptional LysR family regulator|uniref:HTH-type transcriptional regulator BudR n=1 Tax=Pantoea brenneri TaxID=472694 RepID=A0AAX3JBP6_9GAMM|nr:MULTISPECIES: LysR family transcriptional regulator [Pantoea]KKD31053.1 transcriptional regulator [Pantoea sp. 3.5.1]MBS6034284.1 LysR family transcriptional regulator [Pantoea sp.]MDH2124682.1 LysR family transcriptional regulator [Pantoea brenneri]MDU4128537.1 LysR family transcriptional regulator [Pantoea sp.]VXC55599.1 HTH-type transcriptional regulator BudR [Pantoea brenneri]
MELRHLRYFVAVAQTLHFTRAAEMLGISQPPLSQQILRLEQEIGTPLLKRLTRGVELTEAGEAFLEEAQQIVQLADHALENARGIARGISGQMSLGFASSVAFNPRIFALIRQFTARYPAMELLTREENMALLMQDLQEGLLDAAFIRLPCESSKAFNLRVISTEKMLIALPRQHPLSQAPAVALSALAQETLVIFPREVAPSLYELIVSACLRAGFSRQAFQQAPQITSSLGMVGAGCGIALVPESMRCVDNPQICFCEIENNTLFTDVAFAWRRYHPSKAVLHLLSMLAEKPPA